MSERLWRCRFWPRCEIHRGETPPGRYLRDVTMAERAEMRREWWGGMTVREVGRKHGLIPQQAYRCIHGTEKKSKKS